MWKVFHTLVMLCLLAAAAGTAHAVENWFERGAILFQSGHYEKAIEAFDEAVDKDPGHVEVYVHRGAAYFYTGRLEKAIGDYSKVIDLGAGDADVYNNRGAAWYHLGEYDRAIHDTSRAIEMNPEHADAWCNRGTAYFYKGDCHKALEDCAEALSLKPDHVLAMNQVAWVLSTCPDSRYRDGGKALQLARKALDLHPEPSFLDTLAAAMAENGQFEDAAETEARLIEYLEKEGYLGAIPEYMERLKAYEARRPWRDKALLAEVEASPGEPSGKTDSGEKPAEEITLAPGDGPELLVSRGPEPKSGLAPKPDLMIEEDIAESSGSASYDTPPRDGAGTPRSPEPESAPPSPKPETDSAPEGEGGYFVQVGAYHVKENAERHAGELERRGLSPRVYLQPGTSPELYLVSIGRYAERVMANDAASDFAHEEKSGAVVRGMDILRDAKAMEVAAAPPSQPERRAEPETEPEPESQTAPESEPDSKPRPEPEPKQTVQPASPGSGSLANGAFVVQTGSFADRTGAQRAKASLEDKGYVATVFEAGGPAGKPWYVVSVGEYADWAQARDAARAYRELENAEALVRFRAPGPGGRHPSEYVPPRPSSSGKLAQAVSVPVGAYETREYARQHVRILERKGYAPTMYEKRNRDGSTEYVVRVTDYAAAQAAPGEANTPPSGVQASASGGGWTVQVGAYLERRNAEKAMGTLREKGYSPKLFQSTDKKGRTWNAVRVGSHATREEAREAARRYKARESADAVARPAGEL
ncbi:MAG: SPOR domain-containing protein [Desulfatibacillaceae bacterium]